MIATVRAAAEHILAKADLPEAESESLDSEEMWSIFESAISLAEAVLSASPADGAGPGEWRPIETAPKDGSEILLLCVSKAQSFGGTRVLQGSWSGNRGYEKWYTMCNYVMRPTHWQPLPLPPGSPVTAASQRPRIVCLCGSTRFIDAFRQAEFDCTLAGEIVLTIGCDTKSDGQLFKGPEGDAIKAKLDVLHKQKIDLADYILVLNVGGYIGDSTRSEIAHARATGKPVEWLEPSLAEWREDSLLAGSPGTAADEARHRTVSH